MKHTTTTIAFASLLTTFAIGCVAGDNVTAPDEVEPDMVDDDVPAMDDDTVVPKYAKSCEAIRHDQPGAADGEYTLYLDGKASQPWSAYCHDMAGTPAEYLTITDASPTSNYSDYAAGGASPGTTVRTYYKRVRIDPITLEVEIGDQRFSVSTGSLTHSFSEPVTSMPFGVAMGCGAIGSANIDLTGTPFVIADAFALQGTGASGSVTKSADERIANIVGEGFCGWNGPALAPFNPFNAASGKLALDYSL